MRLVFIFFFSFVDHKNQLITNFLQAAASEQRLALSDVQVNARATEPSFGAKMSIWTPGRCKCVNL